MKKEMVKKNIKVLLINPRTRPMNGPDKLSDKHAPLGLAYLAAYIRNEFSVDILDIPATDIADSEIGDYVKNRGYNVVGFTGMSHQVPNAYRLSAKIKEVNPEILVIFGGVHASFCYREALTKGKADFVVIGEGEVTFLELLNAIYNSQTSFEEIEGLAYIENGEIKVNEPREFIKDLDQLSLPARDLLPMGEYFLGETIFGNPMVEVMFSRGCPYNCIFCSSPGFWKRKVRFRSIDNIMKEMRHLVQTYPIKYFAITDDAFTLNKKLVMEFCQRVLEEKLNIKWRCLARADTINEEMLTTMKRAGCVMICYGIESGNQEILNSENKKITIEQIKHAFVLTKKAGIPILALMIIGHPYETHKTINDSIKLIRELKPFRYVFQCMTPYVGTELYNSIAEKTGEIYSKNWEDYFTTEQPIFIPKGLDFQTLKNYHDKFLRENKTFYKVLRRLIIAFKLVGLDIFNLKFMVKPVVYSIYERLPIPLQKGCELVFRYIIRPLWQQVKKLGYGKLNQLRSSTLCK